MKDIAYRGYLIRYNPLNGDRWVEQGGYLIGHCHDSADGRNLIDCLLDGGVPTRDSLG